MKINYALLPAKGHYFLFLAGRGGFLPFATAIASQFGASPALVGAICLTLQITVLVVKPCFGILADKLQQKKVIFMGCLFLSTATLFAICFIPEVEEGLGVFQNQSKTSSLEVCITLPSDGNTEWSTDHCNVTCHVSAQNRLCLDHPSYCQSQNTTGLSQTITFGSFGTSKDGCTMRVFESSAMPHGPVCFNTTRSSCNISCDDGSVSRSAFDVNPQIIYYWILLFTAFVFMGPASSLGDTIVLNMIPKCEVFGRQRMYGSIGFGLSSIIVGQLVDVFSDGTEGNLNFTPAYCVVLIFGMLDFVVASRLKDEKVEKPRNLFRGVGSLFLEPETMLLTMAVFFIGFVSGIMWAFLMVYLLSLRASPLLIGLCIGVQCFVGEMPFMFLSNWFLKKIGHGHSMTLVLAVFGTRFMLYSLINDPWLVLPIETTQGICFGVFFTALATYSSVIALPSSQATMQGILQAVFEGLGAGAGSFAGGLIYQSLGGKTMWLVTGAACCGVAILHGLALVVVQRKKSQKNPSPPQRAEDNDEVKEAEMLQMLPGNDDGKMANH